MAKIFSEKRKADYDDELRNLRQVVTDSQLAPYVPKLEALATRVLVLSPVGTPFAANLRAVASRSAPRPCAHHFQQLLCILRRTHEVGLVHRDLAPQNFFTRKDTGKVRATFVVNQASFLFRY